MLKKTEVYTTATPSQQTGEAATASIIIPEANVNYALTRKTLPPTNELWDDTLEYCYTIVEAKHVGDDAQIFEYQGLIMGDKKILSSEAKGESDLVADGVITISVPEIALQIGKEYIFMINNTRDSEKLEIVGGPCTSRKNSAIPIEDTERINKVYELLGKQKP